MIMGTINKFRKLFHVCFRRRHVFENGWYKLWTAKGWALYRKDGSFVADKLLSCMVYKNGWYELWTEECFAVYRADGTPVKTRA